ncbi:MAG: hypothetical protein V7606_3362 [Burkholderiales bacterium]
MLGLASQPCMIPFVESDVVESNFGIRRNRVTVLEGHLRIERLDAVPNLWLLARCVDFAATAHPPLEIGQYLWPGMP